MKLIFVQLIHLDCLVILVFLDSSLKFVSLFLSLIYTYIYPIKTDIMSSVF